MSDGRDSGHALVEALLLGLILFVPVVWMLSVFGEIHAASLGATSGAREAGFEVARERGPAGADRIARPTIGWALRDHGLDPRRASISWSAPEGWRRGGTVEVVVTYDVPVFQAPFLGEITEPFIRVTAKHVATIDRYRSRSDEG